MASITVPWVISPFFRSMAGVIASTFVGFALDAPLKSKLMKQLNYAMRANIPAVQQVRRDVDPPVWHLARKAVHRHFAVELETRVANAEWQRKREDIGDYTWDQV